MKNVLNHCRVLPPPSPPKCRWPKTTNEGIEEYRDEYKERVKGGGKRKGGIREKGDGND